MERSEARTYHATLKAGMVAFGLRGLDEQAFVENWASNYAEWRSSGWTFDQQVDLGDVRVWTVRSGSYLAIGALYDSAIDDPADPYLHAAKIYKNRIAPTGRGGGGPVLPFPGHEVHTSGRRLAVEPIERAVNAAIDGATVDLSAPREERVEFVPAQLREVLRVFRKDSAYDGIYLAVHTRVNAALEADADAADKPRGNPMSIERHDALAGLKLTEILGRIVPTGAVPRSSLTATARQLLEDEIQ